MRNRIARLYTSLDTPDDRGRATYWVKRAVNIDPDNPEYRLTVAHLLWEKGFWHGAEKEYRSVIKQNPECAEAVYKIGYRSLRQFLQSRTGTAATRSFADEECKRALDFLKLAVEADPEDRDALRQLGLTYIEMDQYDEVIRLAERTAKEDSADTDALLLAGLAYQAKGEYEKACVRYNRALATMPPDEREVLESVVLIADGPPDSLDLALQDSAASRAYVGEVDLDAFWRSRDPLLLTDHNERQMAHYGRVFYAALRFEDPLNGRKGWETDMGKAFIRFGPPPHERSEGTGYRRGHSERADEFWANADFYGVPTHRPGNPMIVWRYESFALKFSGGTNPNNWVFDWKGDPAQWGRLRKKRPPTAQLFRETPPRYVDPYQRLKHSVPHQVAAFKDGDGVRVEVAYALPRNRMRPERGSKVFSLEDGLFLFDEAWNEVTRDRRQFAITWDVPNSAVSSTADSIRSSYLIDRSRLHLPQGTYHLVLEARDPVSHTVATFRDSCTFSYPDTGLVMSDLLLASRVVPEVGSRKSPKGLDIVPNPIRTFGPGNPLWVYLEVYNLARNAFGRTNYQITYQADPPAEEDIDPRLFESFPLARRPGGWSSHPSRAAWLLRARQRHTSRA